MLQDANMQVGDLPPDEGPHSPRQSYNFAPGYHGIVYRASVPDWGAGPAREHAGTSTKTPKTARSKASAAAAIADDDVIPSSQPTAGSETEGGEATHEEIHYKLQSMKWGLIPFWTKRNPDYTSMLKTINCRDDSLASPGGMWASMKGRKRCIVVAQGFYEWLKPANGGRGEKVPHYIKRKDGGLMCMAGLWDCVVYEDKKGRETEEGIGEVADAEKNYTYTIVTTDSNAQLKFLHDRMPVIFDAGSEDLYKWLDPSRYEWSRELQGLLKPFKGELEIYPVSKEVGKVGNNSPSFIIPVASRENKSNIANFFANSKSAKGAAASGEIEKGGETKATEKVVPEVEVEQEVPVSSTEAKTVAKTETLRRAVKEVDDDAITFTPPQSRTWPKRELTLSPTPNESEPMSKKPIKYIDRNRSPSPSPTKSPLKTAKVVKGRVNKISATSNGTKSPVKPKSDGTQRITKFFANSA
jgi:putative SOS response-associated peptidase YedK